jgi:glutathione reductase (NADPH)
MRHYDLFVIGAGPGGLAAAERAAAAGVQVAIAERTAVGGACVNYGCIPEKLLTYAARFATVYQDASSYGWEVGETGALPPVSFNWSKFVAARNQEIQHLNQVHRHKLEQANVEFLHGHAAFLDAHTLCVDRQRITADKILIAVGAKPNKPRFLGANHALTWHELLNLPQQPQRVAIVGNGYIGTKFAGILNGLGSQVTQMFAEDQILRGFDQDLCAAVATGMTNQGIQLLAHTIVEQLEPVPSGLLLKLAPDDRRLTVDAVLVDTGCIPAVDDLNLEQAGIETTPQGAIRVDEYSRTSQPHIFAVGDCTDRRQLTPVAIAEAAAFVDSTFGNRSQAVNYDLVPVYVASHPEAATVGMSEAQARTALGEAVRCYRKQFVPLFYSLTSRQESTLMKVVVDSSSDRVLGIHMVGQTAVEIVQSLAAALKRGLTLTDLRSAIGIHPSIAEEFWSI